MLIVLRFSSRSFPASAFPSPPAMPRGARAPSRGGEVGLEVLV